MKIIIFAQVGAHICVPLHNPHPLKIPHGYKWLPPSVFPLVLGNQLLFVDPPPTALTHASPLALLFLFPVIVAG